MEENSGKEQVDAGTAEVIEPEHSLTIDGLEVPQVGMSFGSEEEVRNYYQSYAYSQGFGIVKLSTKNGDDGRLKYYSLACARSRKALSSVKTPFNPRPSTKTNCKAKINVTVDHDGKFNISRVYLEHNHALTPGKLPRGRWHRHLGGKRRADSDLQGDMRSGKLCGGVAGEAGGYENLPFGDIGQIRQLRLGKGDAEAVRAFFVRMQRRNPHFFYEVDFDDDGHLRNLFWSDARSRAAYESFGDVVFLDTTYLAYRYEMPLAPLLGVNHHGHLVLFGCAVMSSEDKEAFLWLFKSWLECMPCPPNVIVTDQCKAIQEAVMEVFPNTCHRLCLWHIMRRIPGKLGRHPQFKAIKKKLKNVVYESLEASEFEQRWAEMIEEFNLGKIEWLQTLYIDRHQWVPMYIKKTFFGGISTTQRNESISAYFEGFVNSRTSLKQFVEQYDNALKSKVEKENKADFISFNASIPLITDWYFEKQFQDVYTNDIFKLFQDELRGMLYVNVMTARVDGFVSIFQVSDIVKIKECGTMRAVYDVYYNEVEFDIKCLCHMFEFKGVLCRHISKVLIEKNIQKLPPRYILDRWRKDLKRNYTSVKNCYEDFGTNDQKLRFEKLCAYFFQVAEVGAETSTKYEILMKVMEEAREKLLISNFDYYGSKRTM